MVTGIHDPNRGTRKRRGVEKEGEEEEEVVVDVQSWRSSDYGLSRGGHSTIMEGEIMAIAGGTCIIGGYCRETGFNLVTGYIFRGLDKHCQWLFGVVYLKPSMQVSGNIYTNHRLHHYYTLPYIGITIDYVLIANI